MKYTHIFKLGYIMIKSITVKIKEYE